MSYPPRHEARAKLDPAPQLGRDRPGRPLDSGETVRLAELSRDFWELRSGEASARKSPDTFHLPPLEERKGLKRGQAAKLIFEVESEDEAGKRQIQGERMWVIVAERVGATYIGILDSQPASLVPGDDVYLCFGAEIPFLPEHVIEIASPPADYVEWQLSQAPERKWLGD